MQYQDIHIMETAQKENVTLHSIPLVPLKCLIFKDPQNL